MIPIWVSEAIQVISLINRTSNVFFVGKFYTKESLIMPRIDSNWNLAGNFYLILFSGLVVFCLFAIAVTTLFFKETRHNDEASRDELNSEHPKTHKNGILKRISECS